MTHSKRATRGRAYPRPERVKKEKVVGETKAVVKVESGLATAILKRQDRKLTNEQFHRLAQVPPEAEWFANITNPRTRRAYRIDVQDFSRFVGIKKAEEFRIVTRAHVIAWRDELRRRDLSPTTIRRKLSAVASLFDYLCEKNAVTHNPVDGIKRPKANSNEGKTPAISDAQARTLLNTPGE